MARYRKIDTRIWNDKKFNQLSDDGKFVFLFMLTHQHLLPIGAMRTTLSSLASELHWDVNRFKHAFDQIASFNMVKFDASSCLLVLPNFMKYNQPESPNVVKSYEQYLDYLPECELRDHLIEFITSFVCTLTTPFQKALPKAFRKGMSNQEQEHEHEHEQEQEGEEALDVIAEQVEPINIEADQDDDAVGIPLKDGKTYFVSTSQIDQWQTVYSKIDVPHVLRVIQEWNIANPKKRKTQEGIVRHITLWLTRESDKSQNAHNTPGSLFNYNQSIASEWANQGSSSQQAGMH